MDEKTLVGGGEYQREEDLRKHVNWISIAALWIAATSIAAIAIAWVSHLVFPDELRWLGDPELKELKSIIVGVIVGSTGSAFSQRLFNTKNQDTNSL